MSRPVCRALAAIAAAVLVLSGCQFKGVEDIPLPGGVDTGDDPYEVQIEFTDVLDLVPQSAVKVNDVSVGRVQDVQLDGWHATVTVQLDRGVRLPDNAVARLRQTSLLGEKFVSLSPPADGSAQGRLTDGDLIPLSRSGRNPEVEEVLSALSLLLNGGGVDQLATINHELNQVMSGREDRIRSVLGELDTFIGGLDRHKAEIVRAIDGLDELSARLARQRETLEVALDDIGPGVRILADQRRDLTRMLEALSELGEVGTRVIEQSGDNTVADLRALVPIVGKLAEAGHDLPRALELLVTYPFPSTVGNAVRGDYTNLRITADLDLRTIFGNLNPPPAGQEPAPTPPETPKPPQTPDLPPVPELPDLPDPGGVIDRVCEQIPEETPLPGACSNNGAIGAKALPDVVTGLCSLVPAGDKPKECPEKKAPDSDRDGDADVCVVGLVCTDSDARDPRDSGGGGSGGGGGGDPDSGDGGVLCPPLCAAQRPDDALARLMLGGVS